LQCNHLGILKKGFVSPLMAKSIEALNGIFQTAKAKARGYRNVETLNP